GVAAETGVVMLIYLDHALTERRAHCASEARSFTRDDLRAAIMQGAVERVRPKMMTVTAIIAGLLPILWSYGTGSELMQRIAVPMIGGMVSSTVLTLIVIPAVYGLVKGWRLASVRQPLPAPARRAAEGRGTRHDGSGEGRREDVGHGADRIAGRHRADARSRRPGQIPVFQQTLVSGVCERHAAARLFGFSLFGASAAESSPPTCGRTDLCQISPRSPRVISATS